MSQPTKSAASFWNGTLLSFMDDTPAERAYVDGILYTLFELSDPEYPHGVPSAAVVEMITRKVDARREKHPVQPETSTEWALEHDLHDGKRYPHSRYAPTDDDETAARKHLMMARKVNPKAEYYLVRREVTGWVRVEEDS